MPTDDVYQRLLDQVRSDNQKQQEASTLPDIDPSLLLSAEARQEMEFLSRGSVIRMAHVTEGSVDEDAILGIIMGSSEALEVPSSFEVEFAMDEGGAEPNERVRFQIGREPPPRDFSPPSYMRQDGEVVSRVGSRGRFESLPPPGRPHFVPSPAPAPTARPEPPAAPVSKYDLLKTDPF